MLNWYVAKTNPNSEIIAEENIRGTPRLSGITPFNPLCRVSRLHKGARITVDRPYLPGYIFVRFDEDEHPWQRLNSTRGIKRVFTDINQVPLRIPNKAMDIILERCLDGFVKADEVDTALSGLIPIGSVVQLKSGPFEGHKGNVVWSEAERVGVLFMLFGRSNLIEFPVNIIEVKVSCPA